MRSGVYKDQILIRINADKNADIFEISKLSDKLMDEGYEESAMNQQFADFIIPESHFDKIVEYTNKYQTGNIEILHGNVQKLILNQISSLENSNTFNYSTYNTFDDINAWTNDFASAYNFVDMYAAGSTYEGRPISALKFSTNPQAENVMIFNTGFHAREWIGPAHMIYICELIADLIAAGDDKTNSLLSKIDLIVIPVANPDGYAYTWTNERNARMFRKTRSENPGAKCFDPALEYGVDPNRNFDAHWAQPEGASTNVCSIQYKGPYAESEIEVSSHVKFVTEVAAKYENVGYADLHNYSQFWMYPYGYQVSPQAEDTELLHSISTDVVNAIQDTYDTKWKYGPIATTVYVASGSSVDYWYDELGIICAFAVELRDTGKYGFLLPDSEIPLVANEMWNGYSVLLQAIIDGKCGKRAV